MRHIKLSEISAYLGAAIFLGLALGVLVYSQGSAAPFISSELGIATYSPNGQAGGALMPASGCTSTEGGCPPNDDVDGDVSSCTVTLTPTSVGTGDTVTASVTMNTASTTLTDETYRFERCSADASNCVDMSNTNPRLNYTTITTDDLVNGESYIVDVVVSGTYLCSLASEGGASNCTGTASCVAAFSVDDVPQCSDGVDNGDGDGLADAADPNCHTDDDPNDGDDTYDPNDDDEGDTPNQCQDGIDNDGDGLIDFPNDPGCSAPTDDDEGDTPNQCQDGIDNDGDGLIDFPNDPGCSAPTDDDEVNTAIGNPTISVNPGVVRTGQPYDITWDPDTSVDCTLSSNVNDGSGVPDANTAGSATLTAERTMTHTISCSGGEEDSVEIRVLPSLFET